MVITSILRSNRGKCPLWNVDVSVYGWYKEAEGGIWEFLRAECPIIENSKLPKYEQKQEYKLMFCKDNFSCPLYKEFQAKIVNEI